MRIKTLWVLLFLCTGLSAQSPYFRTIPFNNFKVTTIYAMQCDTTGMLWVATNVGLMNYDGIKFHIAIPARNDTDEISCMTITASNEIIVGYRHGMVLFYKIKFTSLLLQDSAHFGYPVTKILKFHSDYCVTTYGRGYYYKKDKKWQHNYSGNSSIDDFVNDVMVYNQKLFFATDNGVYRGNLDNARESISAIKSGNESDALTVSNFAVIKNQHLYAITRSNGLYLYNDADNRFTPDSATGGWNFGEVKCQYAAPDEMWIGTTDDLLIDIDWREQITLRNINNPSSFDYSDIRCIFRDNHGGFWVASNNTLLYSVGERMEILTSVQGIPTGAINAVECGSAGTTYFATKNGVYVSRWLNGKHAIQKLPLPGQYAEVQVVSLFMDADNYLWMATFNDVLLRYNAANGQFAVFLNNSNGLSNASTITIAGDQKEVLLATLGGLYSCEFGARPLHFDFNKEQSELAGTYVYKIIMASDNTMWFATDGNGLLRERNGNIIRYDESSLPQLKVIYTIAQDNKGNIWCGTSKGGLLKFDGKSFTPFHHPMLDNHSVYSLACTGDDNIIAVTDEAVLAIDASDNSATAFGSEQGLFNMKPSPNVTATSGNGIIWTGINNGLIKINTRFLKKENAPPIVLHHMTCMLENVELGEHVFDYDHNHIGFEYAALNYDNPAAVVYQYKLSGFNEQWRETRDESILFSNLDPGTYVFNLRATTQTSFTDANLLQIPFVIKRPYYLTSFFIIGCIAFVLLAGYLLIKARINNIRNKEASKKQKLLFELEGLKMQVNPHFLHNSFNTLVNIIEIDKEAAVTFVEKLSDFFRHILMIQNQDLVPLHEELNVARDYFYLQQQRFGTDVEMLQDITEEQLQKKIPPLTLQILLENVFKHNTITHGSKIFIELRSMENNYLEVKNNIKPKLTRPDSTQVGLKNIVSRYAVFAASKVEVIQTEDFFTVRVPLI